MIEDRQPGSSGKLLETQLRFLAFNTGKVTGLTPWSSSGDVIRKDVGRDSASTCQILHLPLLSLMDANVIFGESFNFSESHVSHLFNEVFMNARHGAKGQNGHLKW